MPRHARLILPGIPVHAVQRGVNRAACFTDDGDRDFYLRQLQRLLGDSGCALHAFCLMTNHVHLLLTPAEHDSCERLFRRLSLVHVQYMNKKYDRTGTLWEGRFRSCIVQSEAYLLTCYRYVELNPVRAGMVRRPQDYPWSSYSANALGATDAGITPHEEYLKLGISAEDRRRRYRSLFQGALDETLLEDIRLNTNAGYSVGTEAFRRDVATQLGRRVSRGAPGRPKLAGEAQGSLL
jgi:putative transposase